MPTDASLKDPPWLNAALSVIRSKGVVALAFERLFGLAANAWDHEAVAKVAAIKSRHERAVGPKPISIILPDLDTISLLTTSFPSAAMKLAEQYWPGPLTIVVPASRALPKPLVSDRGMVGIRIAGSSPAALLAERSGCPLTATSANLSGENEALSHRELEDLDGIDLIVEGTVQGPPGSTIVDASGPTIEVLRKGVIHLEEVL
jgi:L-threonylcarbamoyladenylate synthase